LYEQKPLLMTDQMTSSCCMVAGGHGRRLLRQAARQERGTSGVVSERESTFSATLPS